MPNRVRPPTATEFLKKMRGESQSCLIQASDRHCYVVKFVNNPQGRRCVTNDLLGSYLAQAIGLPVAVPCIINVPKHFVLRYPELCFQVGKRSYPRASGLQFASRVPVDPMKRAVYDFLPRRLFGEVSNLDTALGIWLFDVWVSNADQRQVVFTRRRRNKQRRGLFWLTMIDNGWCFSGQKWKVIDLKRKPVSWQQSAFSAGVGTESFEPYLSRIRSLSVADVQQITASVPAEWIAGEERDFGRLVERISGRAARIDQHLLDCWPWDRNWVPKKAHARARRTATGSQTA